MKRIMRRTIVALMLLALVATGASAQFGTQPGAPAPMPQSLDEALATVVVGDVQGFADNAGGLASKINPMMNAGMIKMRLGQAVGDPQLAGMPAGAGFVLAVFPPNTAVLFVEVAPAQVDAYLQALQMQGRFAAKGGGLLVVANSQTLADSGAAMASQAAALLSGAGAPSIKATAHVDKLMASYGPMIQMMMGAMAMQSANQMQQGGADMEAMRKAQMMMQVQLGVVQQVLQQLKTLRIELAVPTQGIEIKVSGAPLPGSDLAALAAAPPESADDLLAVLPGRGALRGAMGLNGEAFSACSLKMLDKVFAQMPGADDQKKELREAFMLSMRNGTKSSAFDMLYPGMAIVSGVNVSRVSSGADVVETMEKSLAQMKKMGIFGTPQFGVETDMKFQRNAAKYAGVDIHQMRMTIATGDNAIPEQVQMMKAMFGEGGTMAVDFAVIGDKVVQAMGGADIKPMIDAVKAGKNPDAAPLRAVGIIGAGWNGYVSLDLARGLQALQPILMGMPTFAADPSMAQTMQMASQTLANASPVAAGFMVSPAGFTAKLVVPADLLQVAAQAVMQMRMQAQMQRQQQMQPGQ